jgi:hypothetical protein
VSCAGARWHVFEGLLFLGAVFDSGHTGLYRMALFDHALWHFYRAARAKLTEIPMLRGRR